MTIRSLRSRALVLVTGGLLAASAHATVLTFDTTTPLNDFDPFPSAYGDNVSALSDATGSYLQGNGFTPNLSVDYRTYSVVDGTVQNSYLGFWNANYGDLSKVLYTVASSGQFSEITIVPQAGWAVRLNSFDMGGYFQADHPDSQVRILNGASNAVVLDYSPVTIAGAGSTHTTFVPNIVVNGPLSIRFGYNDWNVGIDNINFDQVAAVPEPQTYALMAAGLGLLAWAGRRRRKASE